MPDGGGEKPFPFTSLSEVVAEVEEPAFRARICAITLYYQYILLLIVYSIRAVFTIIFRRFHINWKGRGVRMLQQFRFVVEFHINPYHMNLLINFLVAPVFDKILTFL